jgi:integrase
MPGHGVYTCEPKTPSSYRTVPLPQVVVDALAEHLSLHPAGPDGWLFTAPKGGPDRPHVVYPLSLGTGVQSRWHAGGRNARDAALSRQRPDRTSEDHEHTRA